MYSLNAFKLVECSMRARVQKRLVKTLTSQELQRCFVVQVNIVEGVGQDFGHPHQTGLHILQETQVDGSEQQTPYPQKQPSVANSV